MHKGLRLLLMIHGNGLLAAPGFSRNLMDRDLLTLLRGDRLLTTASWLVEVFHR
jgi:hypothetical protein